MLVAFPAIPSRSDTTCHPLSHETLPHHQPCHILIFLRFFPPFYFPPNQLPSVPIANTVSSLVISLNVLGLGWPAVVCRPSPALPAYVAEVYWNIAHMARYCLQLISCSSWQGSDRYAVRPTFTKIADPCLIPTTEIVITSSYYSFGVWLLCWSAFLKFRPFITQPSTSA